MNGYPNANKNTWLKCYDVSRLRTLYAKLLGSIANDQHTALSHFDDDDDDGRQSIVRNFRKTSISSSNINTEDGDHGDTTISFLNNDVNQSSITVTSYSHIWRLLAATAVKDKEGLTQDNVSTSQKNDEDVRALVQARKHESKVIEFIRSIGELAVCGERQKELTCVKDGIKGSEGVVFEYFCDKNMLSLLVDIVKARPPAFNSTGEHQGTPESSTSSSITFNGVVWTALVKAQVIQTISILISNVKDPTSLYYLLSNNYINELISSIVPLQQWTAPALDEILPVYISFLKTLALQLVNSPHLFQFFCDNNGTILCDNNGTTSSMPTFPLFHAAIEVASSPLNVAQSDTFVHTTALNIILNLCQLPSDEIRSVINESYIEQFLFLSSLCTELSTRYETIATLVVGKKVDAARCESLSEELNKLDVSVQFLNDLLCCGVRSLNVRLCEYLMHHVIVKLILHHISIYSVESVSSDTNDDDESNENEYDQEEAYVQSSVLFLAKMFMIIDYAPLLKMVAVALLHPYSPIDDQLEELERHGKEYVVTPALNAIAQNDFVVVTNTSKNDLFNISNAVMEESTTHIVDSASTCCSDEGSDSSISIAASLNPVRSVILSILSGDHKSGMFTTTAVLVESILEAGAIDYEMLKMLKIVPDYSKLESEEAMSNSSAEDNADDKENFSSQFEAAIGNLFSTHHSESQSTGRVLAFDIGVSLLICYMNSMMTSFTEEDTNFADFKSRFQSSHLIKQLGHAKNKFSSECEALQIGVSEIFPDLVEMEIKQLYNKMKDAKNDTMKREFSCNLRKVNASTLINDPEILIRKEMGVTMGEVMDVRFSVRNVLILSLLKEVVDEHYDRITSQMYCKSSSNGASLQLRTMCPPSDKIVLIGGINNKPTVGSEICFSGKKIFHFSPSLAISDEKEEKIGLSQGSVFTEKETRRHIADKILKNSSRKKEMILVVDDSMIFVLKPKARSSDRGIILCHTYIRNMIAVASDGQWLHIALRNVEDIGVLVQKGNMALRFENEETCLSVKECVESCRDDSKKIIMTHISEVFRSSK